MSEIKEMEITKEDPKDENQSNEEFNKPECQLSGEDGNVFAIIGRVTTALKRDGQKERAKEFTNKAFNSESYDAVLKLCYEYVKEKNKKWEK